ncbi:MAG: hypothetical protein ACHP8B_10865 [Terriglobales bacterium]
MTLDKDIEQELERLAKQEEPRLGGRNEQELAHVKTVNDALLRRDQ